MNYYDGIRSFKGYLRRVFGYDAPYDWADLSREERKRFAARERTPRERRGEAR
jgi:hypothetical protein